MTIRNLLYSFVIRKTIFKLKLLQLFDNITDEEIQTIIQKGIILDISRQTETVTKGRKESPGTNVGANLVFALDPDRQIG